MITNNINRVLTKAYEEFLNGLCPKPDLDQDKVLKTIQITPKIAISIGDLFEKQRNTDKAKSVCGKYFPQAMRLYFAHFLAKDTVDFKRLKYGLTPYEANFLRHLGKDRLAFLKLLISIADEIQEKRKGLLFGDAS